MNEARFSRLSRIALVSLALALTAACSTAPVSVTYDAANVAKSTGVAKQAIALSQVTDSRKNDANWLGAIRGGLGNPLKTLETPQPVGQVVKAAILDGLTARDMLAAGEGRYDMRVEIFRFDCSQYVRREAHVRFLVTLTRRSTGKEVYSRNVTVDKVQENSNLFDVGIAADPEDLRKVANQALQEAIDQMLNDTGLIGQLI